MRIDTLAVRLRPRTPLEAADLGARLCQHAARAVYPSYVMVALPALALALATIEIRPWLPALVIWWIKPWLDRTILFVLSRAAFGQPTTPADVWRAQREVWWRRLLVSLTLRRLSPWRSVTEPVYLLEGLPLGAAMARARQIRQRATGAALMMTSAFTTAWFVLNLSQLSLIVWFAPAAQTPSVQAFLTGEWTMTMSLLPALATVVTVLFLEPFYVAAGFAMYLNRRAELEAWDIEQEFRRAFQR